MKRVVFHLGLISAAALIFGTAPALAAPAPATIQLAQYDGPDNSAAPDTQQDDNSGADQPDDNSGTDQPDDNSGMDVPDDGSNDSSGDLPPDDNGQDYPDNGQM